MMSLASRIVISPRAPETAPTPVDGVRIMTEPSATFGLKSPRNIKSRKTPNVSMLYGSAPCGSEAPADGACCASPLDGPMPITARNEMSMRIELLCVFMPIPHTADAPQRFSDKPQAPPLVRDRDQCRSADGSDRFAILTPAGRCG